ncbi:hypothetical protein ACFJGX_26740 [Hydrogenophaga sp. UC242_50]|uniref:hypothetical protein n=1 Tax=Hydrogenophaga sp. UC242_50 TaxID=3350169 RepID=UPI0036D20A0A
MKFPHLACMAAIAVALAACQDRTPAAAPAAGASAPAAPAPAPTPAAPAPATDAWLGQWNGPEGTYLQLAGSGCAVRGDHPQPRRPPHVPGQGGG